MTTVFNTEVLCRSF